MLSGGVSISLKIPNAAGLNFAANVDLRCGHLANENYRQSGGDSLPGERLHFGSHFSFYFASNCDAI
jgi:hypothetical protein